MNSRQALLRASSLALLLSAAALSPAGAAAHAGGHGSHGDHGKPMAKAGAADLAEGEVRKVDKDGGKLTLKHGEIKSLEMPASSS